MPMTWPEVNEEDLHADEPQDLLQVKPIGVIKAGAMGLMKGGALIGLAATRAAAGLRYEVGNDQAAQEAYDFSKEVMEPAVKFWTPDPGSMSAAGEIVHNFMQMGFPLLTGEAALPLLAGESTMNTAADLSEQGVDDKTALEGGVISGVGTAALGAMPLAGRTFLKTAGLAALGVGSGVANRAAMNKLLNAGGYKELAQAYDPFDPYAMAIDTLQVGAFAALGHLQLRAAEKTFNLEKKNAIDKLGVLASSPTYQEVLSRLPIDTEDAITMIRDYQKKIRDTPFDPAKPGAIQTHLDSLTKAMDDLANGQPVDVSSEIQKAFEVQAPPANPLTGEAFETPGDLQDGIKSLLDEQANTERLLKSGYDLKREAERQGVDPAELQEGLRNKLDTLTQGFNTLQDYAGSGDFATWKRAIEEGSPISFKKDESPETATAQEIAKEAIANSDQAIKETAATSGVPEPETVTEDFFTGRQITDKYKGTPVETGEAPTPAQLKNERSERKIVQEKTIQAWVKRKGGIDYNNEHLKGELDGLLENGVKGVIKKNGKGRTLDRLALMAKDEGWISEATPHELLDALHENRLHPSVAEDLAARRMEAESMKYSAVDRAITEKGDIIGGDIVGLDARGNPVYKGMKTTIEEARAAIENTAALEELHKRIGLCIRSGG
jgi:hypothetical protein